MAVAADSVGGIEAGAGAPTITAAGSRVALSMPEFPDQISGRMEIGLRRDGPIWWVMLTGLGPDGNRYRLSEGHLLTAEPIGSAWEWLTAPG